MPESAPDRATLLIAVPAATVAFSLAFNLGAFDEIFFDVILSVWVISTLVLVFSFLSKRLPPQYWGGRIVLLLPTLWLVLAFVENPEKEGFLEKTLFPTSLVVTLICLPFITWILVSAINPDFVELPMRNRWIVGITVVVFAVAGYAFGARNDWFLNCADFKVSGNDLPENCVKVEPTGAGPLIVEVDGRSFAADWSS